MISMFTKNYLQFYHKSKTIMYYSDCYPGSLCHNNRHDHNTNALHLESIGEENITNNRLEIINFIIDRNMRSLDYVDERSDNTMLHTLLERKVVSSINMS